MHVHLFCLTLSLSLLPTPSLFPSNLPSPPPGPPLLAPFHHQVLVNNLAGAGPDHSASDLSGPAAPELRWRAATYQGTPVDVVPGTQGLVGRWFGRPSPPRMVERMPTGMVWCFFRSEMVV